MSDKGRILGIGGIFFKSAKKDEIGRVRVQGRPPRMGISEGGGMRWMIARRAAEVKEPILWLWFTFLFSLDVR